MPNTIMQVSIPEVLNNPNNETRMNECMVLMKENQLTLKEGLKDESYCTFGYSAGALYATIILDLQKLNFENSIDFAKHMFAA
jgi:aspartate/methionine/tyrosine aminotransferase